MSRKSSFENVPKPALRISLPYEAGTEQPSFLDSNQLRTHVLQGCKMSLSVVHSGFIACSILQSLTPWEEDSHAVLGSLLP